MNKYQKILDAFNGVKHPGNKNLLRRDGIDDIDVCFLYAYEGKPWTELDSKLLIREYACLTALSDSGLSYVIPAYLTIYDDGNADDPYGWIDRLLTVLAENGRGDLKLTSNQFSVVEDVFFSPMLKEWRKYGKACTALGLNVEDLVNDAKLANEKK